MAPSATKRRKLDHSDSDEESEASFAGFDDSNGEESVNAAPAVATGAIKTVPSQKPQKRTAMTLPEGAYTAETFKSNMFKLQVDDLLAQAKLKYSKKEAPAENAMRTLKTIIEQIPDRGPLSIPEAEKTLKAAGVAIPFPDPRPPKDAMYKLQYQRPTSINAAGSYPLKTATRSDHELVIDLVVTMPGHIFQEKDYLNHRYFYKRAYYLACLAAGIKQSKKHKFNLAFDLMNGNQLQPVLITQPSGNGDEDDFSSSKCQIRIVLAIPENTFPQHKLFPNSNCVRPKGSEDETTDKVLLPTPFYNSTLQADVNIIPYLKFLHATATKVESFKDACILGRIWLKQRGFESHIRKGGFGNFEWAAIMNLLLQPNAVTGAQALSSGYSSYQLFKATLQFLGRGDLTKKPFSFQAPNITIPKTETNGPVIFDGPRGQNILFKMTHWSYKRLQIEARATVEMLSDSVFDEFDSTFILKTELYKYRYDATLKLPLSALEISANSSYDQTLIGNCRKIYSTLTRALTDRISVLSFTLPEENSWSITSKRPKEDQRKGLLISFATNPANANRTVDHGPSAENKLESASFRKFWGEKAELRRFKDGSILESVVWSIKDTSATVIEQIVSYILKKHIREQVAEHIEFTQDIFANLVPGGRIQGASSIAPFQGIMNAFSDLEKHIRDLEDLPLRLRHIRSADPQLCYTSTESPTAGHAPASVVLQFEGSGRWPDDLCAIQRTKIAFLLKLSDLLGQLEAGYVPRVGLENPSQPAQNQGFLDITTSAGCTFRIRIYHDREVTLFERQLKDKDLDAPSRESAAASLALCRRDYVESPLHTQVVQTLCTRFLALSPAIRLMKQWFASHLLSPHFAPELIDLIVIRTFLQPYPWPVPSTATTGFIRTLSWISRWDWRHVPLIVDFSSNFSANPADLENSSTSRSMKTEDLEKIQTRFEAWRRIDPAMNRVVLFAATNLSDEGTRWTDRSRPGKVVAARLTALTKAATQVIRTDEERLLQSINNTSETQVEATLNVESLFTPSISEYDIVITIASKHVLKSSSSKKAKSQHHFKNLDLQKSFSSSAHPPLPELFAQDLLSLYGDAVLWFWNPESLEHVVGLWNPMQTARRKWKVKPGWNSVPLNGKESIVDMEEAGVDIEINKEAVVNEIRRLGGELVKKVDVK